LKSDIKNIKIAYKIGLKCFPICRSLTGEGNRETLKIIKKNLKKLKIKEVKSGTKVFDWKIPPEWNVKNAYVVDKNNKKIIDFKNNNLHLISYSQPIKKLLNKDQLLHRLHSLKEQPNAIPYMTSYYDKNWGFCISHNQKKIIKNNYKSNDKFKILIDTNFNKNGSLTYGELLIKGKLKKEIFISTYICHPSMANNELSGPLMAMLVANHFIKKKNTYSLRIIFIPETIGSIMYLKKNLQSLKKNVICGLNLTCIGDEREFSYLPTKYGNTLADRAILKNYEELKIKFKKYSFLDRGSDERQYNSPRVDLPVASIMRSKYGTYPEYHTSLDNFDLVTEKGLLESFKVVKNCINLLMKNIFPITSVICEPHLSKRNLYPKLAKKTNSVFKTRKIMDFIQYADGNNDLIQISNFIKISFKETYEIFKILYKKKLIKIKKI
jgi:aminopeptidase-like protein